ncbi:unnamed protein product [Moneuplotes crassus]|uniref:CSC1/OSCA1-like cytosolic domain-containing protein n=1 Tax=Euplotes crassus TaxID=5936 RepID=A0AAD1XQM3_EUPCR|nr:unnamed protein product [Moneuplotes crassus]
MVVYSVMVACTSITGWVIYSNGGDGDQWLDPEEPTPFSTIISIGNLGVSSNEYNSSKVYIICALNTVAMVIIYILNIAYKPLQLKVIEKVDEINISPADFAVMVSNIPKDKNKEQIMEWLISQEEGKICDINLCYDIKEPIQKLKKVEKLKKIVTNYEKMKSGLLGLATTVPKSKSELEKEITDLEEEVENFKEKLKSEDTDRNFTGKAFVIYNQQSDIVNITTKFHQTWIRKVYDFLMIYLCNGKEKVQDSCWWDGQRVTVERSAEPTNIYFENMAVEEKTRFYRSFVTYFFAFLCLCCVFLINLFLSFLREELGGASNKNKSTAEIVISSIISISFVSSIVIANNNSVLAKVVRYISKYERHETYTKFNLTIALKLTACMFINTAVIPFIVKGDKKDWFGPDGLANDAFLIIIIMNFVTPTINLIGFGNIFRILRLKYEKWRGEKSTMIQKEANKLSEGVEFDKPFLYAITMVTFYITCFFTPMIPMLPIISLLGIVYKYFVDRYLLLRRCSLPQEMSEQMAMTFSDLVPLGVFLYALGQFIVVSQLSNGKNKLPYLALGLSVIGLFVPFRQIFQKSLSRVKRNDGETYDKNKSKFITDYDRCNPVTEKEAKLKHIEEIGNMGANEDALRKKYKKSHKGRRVAPAKKNLDEIISLDEEVKDEDPRKEWTVEKMMEDPKDSSGNNNWMMKPSCQKSSFEKSEKASEKDDISAIVSEVLNKSAKEDDMIVKQVLKEEEEKEHQIRQQEKLHQRRQQEEKEKQDQMHEKMIEEEIGNIQEKKESDSSGRLKSLDQATIEGHEDKEDMVDSLNESHSANQKSEGLSEEKPQRKIAWRVGEVKIGAQKSDSTPES